MRVVQTLGAGLMLTLLLGGCTASRHVAMDWMQIDGGRSSGTLQLAVMWNPQHDKPDFDPVKAQIQADEKCRAWGYVAAEQVGDMETMCTRTSSGLLGTCTRKEAVLTFRCTNSGTLQKL